MQTPELGFTPRAEMSRSRMRRGTGRPGKQHGGAGRWQRATLGRCPAQQHRASEQRRGAPTSLGDPYGLGEPSRPLPCLLDPFRPSSSSEPTLLGSSNFQDAPVPIPATSLKAKWVPSGDSSGAFYSRGGSNLRNRSKQEESCLWARSFSGHQAISARSLTTL